MASQEAAERARWLKRYGHGGPVVARVFCFHHAGGTAAMYRDWPSLLPPAIEVVAVQLPGRADRLRERPFTEMASLVAMLADVVDPLLDVPFVYYGHSMGAKLCWALSHRLRDQGQPTPAALYLAGAAAPGWPEGRTDWNVPDEDLVEYVRALGGTQPEVFAYPELVAALLPTLRADLTLVDTFQFQPVAPLDVPIRAFAGAADVEGSPERMRGWARQTNGPFTLDALPGGHFFDAAEQRQVARVIADDLAEAGGAAVIRARPRTPPAPRSPR